MYSASKIAAALVQKAIDAGNPVTQMKLQKMAYFAQGYNLAKYDKELFSEPIQAWKFGPVIPVIYGDYKLYGNLPITDFDRAMNEYSWLGFSYKDLEGEIKEAVEYTWKATGDRTAAELSNWTHKQGSPWQEVYNPNDQSILIEKESIKKYFKNFLFS